MLGLLLLIFFNVAAQQGWWSATLHRADGNDIAFTFEWKTLKGKPVWYIHNAAEKIKVDNIQEVGDSLFIQMPVFESQFRIKKTGKLLTGVWIKTGALKLMVIPFNAKQGNQRFSPGLAAAKNISGNWAVSFANSKPNELSVGVFKQVGNNVTGTFLNSTGDYRYLQGIVKNDSLFLSGFDGGHSFLLTAKIDDNKTITGGNFFSGATYREGWSAIKDAKAKVPGESVAMFVKPGEESLDFSFKDLEGKQVAINSDRFKNKVVVIQLMGSWCPNCMDETAFLSEYYNANKQRGVEVIALAYEYTTDWERSVNSLKKFQQRFDVQYPILNTEVTVSDSLRTEKTLPQVTSIKFFPSSIIIDKKGKIRKLDTGFNGPATGTYYVAYKKEFYDTIDKLLKENL
jgi:peroxiredoxin